MLLTQLGPHTATGMKYLMRAMRLDQCRLIVKFNEELLATRIEYPYKDRYAERSI